MLSIEVVYLTPEKQQIKTLALPEGSTIAEALAASQMNLPANVSVGIWGQKRPLSWVLASDDRLEIYRPLTQTPMDARNQRVKQSRKR